jgi:hypothetical protein
VWEVAFTACVVFSFCFFSTVSGAGIWLLWASCCSGISGGDGCVPVVRPLQKANELLPTHRLWRCTPRNAGGQNVG